MSFPEFPRILSRVLSLSGPFLYVSVEFFQFMLEGMEGVDRRGWESETVIVPIFTLGRQLLTPLDVLSFLFLRGS